MQNHFDREYFRRHPVPPPANGNWEKFAQVPALFFEHLSPEQYQAMQQFYRVAYEQARVQTSPSQSPHNEPDFGFGI